MNEREIQLEDLAWAFSHIPQLAGFDHANTTVTLLPGLSNRNYRLQHADQDWVLRIPRAGTNELIDREAEAHNQMLASWACWVASASCCPPSTARAV